MERGRFGTAVRRGRNRAEDNRAGEDNSGDGARATGPRFTSNQRQRQGGLQWVRSRGERQRELGVERQEQGGFGRGDRRGQDDRGGGRRGAEKR